MPKTIVNYDEHEVADLVRRDAQARLGFPVLASQMKEIPGGGFEIVLRNDQAFQTETLTLRDRRHVT